MVAVLLKCIENAFALEYELVVPQLAIVHGK
jgi:hypothetical protein